MTSSTEKRGASDEPKQPPRYDLQRLWEERYLHHKLKQEYGRLDCRLHFLCLVFHDFNERWWEMISRVARYFAVKVLRDKGLRICPLCDDNVISTQEHACVYCELSASWGVVQ